MQKILTMSQIGYNHPSQANWNYGIWKVDLIDPTQRYCMSWTVRETFGGEVRFNDRIKEVTGRDVIETKGVYTGTGTPHITGVRKLQDMESKGFIKEVLERLV